MREVSRPRRILLFGSDGGGGLAACRALGEAGHQVSILRLTPERTPADYSRFRQHSFFIGAPESGVRDYVVRLRELLRRQAFDYLLPLDDLALELASFDYADISALTRIIGPDPAAYAIARDKVAVMALADKIGLQRPRFHLIPQNGPAPAPILPCFVGARFPCAILEDELQRFRVRKVTTPDQLDAKLRDDLPRADVVIQAPIGGARVTLTFCAINGEALAAVEARRIREPRGGCWKIGNMDPGRLEPIKALTRELHWTGFMSIDCREEAEGLSVIKLSWGLNDIVARSRLAGVDFLNLLLDGMEGFRRPDIALPRTSVSWRDQKGLRSAIKKKVGGLKPIGVLTEFFAWLLDGATGLTVEQFADPAPALFPLGFAVNTVRRKIGWRISWALRRGSAHAQAVKGFGRDSSLLIVCQGNINRSAVAEYLFRERGFTRVRSAGLLVMSGRRSSAQAQNYIAERLGVDISGFRSSSVGRALKESGDPEFVVCFERRQAIELMRRFPTLGDKVVLLSALAGERGTRLDVADPHGKPAQAYLSCFRRIDALVERVPICENPNSTRPS